MRLSLQVCLAAPSGCSLEGPPHENQGTPVELGFQDQGLGFAGWLQTGSPCSGDEGAPCEVDGQPGESNMWTSRQTWVWESCAVTFLFYSQDSRQSGL